MPQCGNPECKKELPKNRAYCNEKCLKRYFELKKQGKHQLLDIAHASNPLKISGTNSEWAAQDRSRNTMNGILKYCIDSCPMEKETLIAKLRYITGLSWRKIDEDYFRTLRKVGALLIDSSNMVTVTELGKQLLKQNTDRGDSSDEAA